VSCNSRYYRSRTSFTCHLGDTHHGMLRNRVRHLPRQTRVCVGGGDIDDHSTPDVTGATPAGVGAGLLRLHGFDLSADTKHHAFAIDVHHVVKIFDNTVGYWSIGAIVDLLRRVVVSQYTVGACRY